MQSKPSLYDELSKYANKKGVLIIIDSDTLSEVALSNKKYIYKEAENQLVIGGLELNPQDQDDLFRFLNENQEDGVDILDSEQEEIISNYEGYSDTLNIYNDTIEYFQGKIPKNDIWALKMAYFMRILNDKEEDISEYRVQIRERFGHRGLYISNLCNSSYYENQLRAAYSRLETGRFREYYELRVGMELAAIFVHSGMTEKSLDNIIADKVFQCAQNDIFTFNIHAMGRLNVDLVSCQSKIVG